MFLTCLYDEGLSSSTVKGYRAALNTVFKAAGNLHLVSDCHVTDLIKAFGIERPITRRLFPAWDLPLVLRSLRIAPYEPLHAALLQDITKKTVFLLALASGKRRGELAALIADNLHLQFARDNSKVTLIPDVMFRGKTQRSDSAALPWSIPALTPFVGPTELDRLMCPVRALRWYLQKTSTNPLRGPRSQLFLPYTDRAAKTTPAMISAWICRTVWRAYTLEPENTDTNNARVTAHEIRAFAASWSAFNHVPMEDVMRAASWKNDTTFTTFYLKDLCHQTDGLYSLGPLVSGQQVVQRPVPNAQHP